MIIGVLARPFKNESNKDVYGSNKEIIDVIISHGGIPLIIPANYIESFYDKDYINTYKMNEKEISNLHKVLDICDGVILQGGDNFYDYDINATEFLYDNDIPTLGICLGMQTMGCFFGGKLVDINNDNHKKTGQDYVHEVFINKNSKFYNYIQKDIINVNSRHKSRVINTSLRSVGFSSDNVLEVLEDSNKRFFIGVQWHPESMITYDVIAQKLFKCFFAECRMGR